MGKKKSKRIDKNCLTCNKEFSHIPSRPQKYCSGACYHANPTIKQNRKEIWNYLFNKDNS